jgi:hypothetical protein
MKVFYRKVYVLFSKIPFAFIENGKHEVIYGSGKR